MKEIYTLVLIKGGVRLYLVSAYVVGEGFRDFLNGTCELPLIGFVLLYFIVLG